MSRKVGPVRRGVHARESRFSMIQPIQSQDSLAGEHDAFVVLMTSVQLKMYAYIQTLVPNSADAHDVLQETNLALWAKRAEYDSDRPFWPWACRFAKLQSLALSKKRTGDRHKFSSQLVEILAEEGVAENEAFESELSALEKCLQKVGDRGQELLTLRYRKSLSCGEIASRLGRTQGAIWDALYRVRNMLAGCVRRSLSAEGAE